MRYNIVLYDNRDHSPYTLHCISFDWIGLSSVLRPCQQCTVGYMGDRFTGQNLNQQYQSTEGRSYKGKSRKIKQQKTHTNTK